MHLPRVGRIDRLARREGEALARGRFAVLCAIGAPIPKEWPEAIVAARVAAEDLGLEGVNLDALADRINQEAAAAWAVLARRPA